ncbi:hypothetical protein PsorP6_004751 [Peronosclerospora sorghi]|uniref:Uncharacterized protein n=1 Tax=Peronosclerospora sorghi TaxID=230839 RepID=A0ACC0VKB7_9STRA|nr:hypothetical protein PsorP6_004751 [Peronosclerospora sorghi]
MLTDCVGDPIFSFYGHFQIVCPTARHLPHRSFDFPMLTSMPERMRLLPTGGPFGCDAGGFKTGIPERFDVLEEAPELEEGSELEDSSEFEEGSEREATAAASRTEADRWRHLCGMYVRRP